MTPEIWNLDQSLAYLAWGVHAEETTTVIIGDQSQPVPSLIERMANGGGGSLQTPPPAAWTQGRPEPIAEMHRQSDGSLRPKFLPQPNSNPDFTPNPAEGYQDFLLRACREGKVRVRGHEMGQGDLKRIAKTKWADLKFRIRFLGLSDAGPADGTGTHWTQLQFRAEAVRELRDALIANLASADAAPNHTTATSRHQKLRDWWPGYVARHQQGRPPSRDQDWAAARKEVSTDVRREAVRKLRRGSMTPDNWKRGGAPKKATKKPG